MGGGSEKPYHHHGLASWGGGQKNLIIIMAWLRGGGGQKNLIIIMAWLRGAGGVRKTLSSSWLGFANEDLRRLSTLSSTAGTLVADQTDAGETGLRAVSTGKCGVWCGGGGGAGLPCL